MKVLDYDGTEHLINKLIDTINSGGSADYIVEENISGIWYYRKWASGIYEAWCNTDISTAMTNPIQNTYYGNITLNISGLSFTSIWTINVTGRANGSYFGTKLENYSTTQITLSSRSSASYTTGIRYNISIKGLWKVFNPSVSRFDSSVKYYTPTFASNISVPSWGSVHVAKLGKIHIINSWGIQSSVTQSSDTHILTLESGHTYQTGRGVFANAGNDKETAILRVQADGKVFANAMLANRQYFGQVICFEE